MTDARQLLFGPCPTCLRPICQCLKTDARRSPCDFRQPGCSNRGTTINGVWICDQHQQPDARREVVTQRYNYRPGVYDTTIKGFRPGMEANEQGDWVLFTAYSTLADRLAASEKLLKTALAVAKGLGKPEDWLTMASGIVRSENVELKQRLAEVERERDDEAARASRLYQDRYDLLNATTTEGMSAAEWQMRTAKAEREAKEQKAKQAFLVQQLTDAEATIARLEGDCQAYAKWHSDHSMHVMLTNERHDELIKAEQQVARLREVITDALKVAEFECHPFRPWHEAAKQALRETGA